MMEEDGEDGARRKRKIRFDTVNFTGEESHAVRDEKWMHAKEKGDSPKSYRESLLQNVSTRTCWWEWSKAEEEDSTEDFGVGTDFAKVLNPSDGINVDITNPMCPRFCFKEEEKARLMKPFGRTLVVKLLGRQPSYGFMLKKLRQIWERKGSIDVFDLQNNFYLVKFQRSEDYMEALTGGPWVINDAYLNVGRWRLDFNPKNERIASVVAWVRLPDLPAPLFDKKFLLNLGNVIGKAIKLDIHTAQRARGKFARMCVEVVYESMGLLCTRCGVFGHTWETRYAGGKYSRGKDLREEVVWKKADSELWKNLARIWPSVIKNLYWEVGNGKEVRFWTDRWLDHDKKLIELCNNQQVEIDEKLLVADVVAENGE
ncbi:hypothetical protein K1719_042444 [Acacia pycnantha]|nr:hypothetical protein K1719_042444 [Acacia pycnantha]